VSGDNASDAPATVFAACTAIPELVIGPVADDSGDVAAETAWLAVPGTATVTDGTVAVAFTGGGAVAATVVGSGGVRTVAVGVVTAGVETVGVETVAGVDTVGVVTVGVVTVGVDTVGVEIVGVDTDGSAVVIRSAGRPPPSAAPASAPAAKPTAASPYHPLRRRTTIPAPPRNEQKHLFGPLRHRYP